LSLDPPIRLIGSFVLASALLDPMPVIAARDISDALVINFLRFKSVSIFRLQYSLL
jgi:hypothetical protein